MRLQLNFGDLPVVIDVDLVEEIVRDRVALVDKADIEVAQPGLLPQRREAFEARAQLVARDLSVVVDVHDPADANAWCEPTWTRQQCAGLLPPGFDVQYGLEEVCDGRRSVARGAQVLAELRNRELAITIEV